MQGESEKSPQLKKSSEKNNLDIFEQSEQTDSRLKAVGRENLLIYLMGGRFIGLTSAPSISP